MHATLAESLEILLPSLGSTFIGPSARQRLRALAGHLAPMARGGFECRLSPRASQVDLQQCVVPDDESLMEWQASIATSPGWSPLRHFLAAWLKPSSRLHDHISEIWLEFDVNHVATSLPLPAMFFGLPQDVSPAVDTYKIAAQCLDLLLGQSWYDWQELLYRCFAACPDGVFISHIGVMLSRNAPALRVNVKRLQPHLLAPYLQQIRWQGSIREATALMTQWSAFVDRITVCLDVGQHVYPQIGFECILLNQPQSHSRWAMFLEALVKQGLCAPDKPSALLDWPGQTTPMNALAPWPSHLIAASLFQPKDVFTSFDRRLSHIKLAWHPERALEAKAYLWFQHQWISREY